MVWWVPYLNKGCNPDFNNGLGGDSNSGPVLASWRLFEPDSNNGPSPGHSNLVSDEVYICLSFLLMISWWLPYLANSPTPDFNSGPGIDSNIGCILALQHLFESHLNNGPQAIPILPVLDGVYICSGLLLMVSWWVPYLPKGCGRDFSNGLGGDLNSVVPFWIPGVHSSRTRIMAHPRPFQCWTAIKV